MRVVTARSLSVVTVTTVMFIAPMAVLIWRDPPHCTGQQNVTVQLAVVSTVMRIDNAGSGRANEKK